MSLTKLNRNHLRRVLLFLAQHWKASLGIILLMTIEVIFHIRSFTIPRPSTNLDPPFYTTCHDPSTMNSTARANATFMMLARNSDVSGAVQSVKSVQAQFNQHFGYPWVFLNDEEWSEEFKMEVGKAVGEGVSVTFDTIPWEVWGFPMWIDREKARRKMKKMEREGVMYAGEESYHHMCRFQSGFFYDHPALLPYKFYWRVEPDIRFTCAIPYDPFLSMSQHDKKYGYAIALWERGNTVPSLFRKISDYKARRHVRTTPLWTALMAPSYAPWLIRRFVLSLLRNRDGKGDLWNMCHLWSNFEIADMEFFRSSAYRELFRYLDEDGGFYYERWGDAAVHSLGVAMLLRPDEVHWFSDWGYVHGGLQVCPKEGLGCGCECEEGGREVETVCLDSIRRTVE
ncbi:hypothetical protein N0V83_006322 [Neocucurbitaria cava]|uniref:Uncharacterized protein n=1 Tax=Neocucurbitaria cava TaxID=798079 RepID=A0A9W8Y732_9PLEO|nr:hypothetical protein N0V83_006322 [Neocucurbitaria cava]